MDYKEKAPKRGHWLEYLLDIMSIITSILFVIGCYCFQSSNDEVYAFGDWLFIVACVINTAMACHDLLESLHHNSLMTLVHHPKGRDEVLESLCFTVSSVFFTVGCVCFLPSMGESFLVTAIGAWCCILGSFGLVYGVFYTAMGFQAQPGHEHPESNLEHETAERLRQITKVRVSLGLVGTVLFCVGSFMYRPVFGGICPPRSSNAVCEAVAVFGTRCYLYGSYFFLVASTLTLVTTTLKSGANANGEPTETSKLVTHGWPGL
jgi:hypothetical protein